MGRIIRYTIAGMLGAIIAWMIMEPTPLMPDVERPFSYIALFIVGLISGLFIGLLLGLAEAASGLSTRDAVKCVISGALVGAAGGILGMTFGNAVYNLMFGLAGAGAPVQHLPDNIPAQAQLQSESTPGLLSFLLLLIGRGFGWALIGAFIGLSQGIATSSTKKMVNGFVGGLIGGGIGGSVFEILVWMNKGGVANFTPAMIRFVSFSITGASIGLFIGFIEEATKKAWLLRLVGRNEGKEYTIFKSVTTFGRSEYVDIPIYNDPDVSEKHASITTQGQRHILEDLGSSYGTTVNGVKISKDTLRDGDTIEIGKTKFLFRDKATARVSGRDPQPYGANVNIPNSQHVCQFCGSVKDANGNCSCSVGSSAPQVSPTTNMSQQTMQQPAQPSPFSSPFDQTQQHTTQSIPQQPPVPAAGSDPRFTVAVGPNVGQSFALKSGETQIGRDATKDIALPMDNSVSRNHARVAQEVMCYVLYDNGSTNGTYVNGTRITRHELVNGDIVQIGNSKFRFEA